MKTLITCLNRNLCLYLIVMLHRFIVASFYCLCIHTNKNDLANLNSIHSVSLLYAYELWARLGEMANFLHMFFCSVIQKS